RHAACRKRSCKANEPRFVNPQPMDSVQQHDSWRMREIARRIRASTQLLVLAWEAKWLFINRVSFEVGEASSVVRIGKPSKYPSGAKVAICGGNCGGDSDQQNDSRNKFFRVPQI